MGNEIFKIFCLLGTPTILQTDSGREFFNKVVAELANTWTVRLLRGRPRHPQSQGSVERANQDFKNQLRLRMLEGKEARWSEALHYVQFTKNNSYHTTIKQTPFEALFGHKCGQGVKSLNLPPEIADTLNDEEDLANLIRIQNTADEETTEDAPEADVSTTSHDDTAMDASSADETTVEHDDTAMETGSADDTALDDAQFYTAREDAVQVFPDDDAGRPVAQAKMLQPEAQYHVMQAAKPTFCCGCDKPTSGQHQCRTCESPVHATCGTVIEDEWGAPQIECQLCSRKDRMKLARSKARDGMASAAEKMKTSSLKQLPDLNVGDAVLVPVAMVDRGPLDLRNILAVVLQERNNVFQVGTKHGTIKGWFNKADLGNAGTSTLSVKDVPKEIVLSVREVVRKVSPGSGQGYRKCNCRPSAKQCATKRCNCKQSELLCGSHCHDSLPCTNK